MSSPPKRTAEEQAKLDEQLRNASYREQTRQRKAQGDEPRRRQVTLEQLPLFASEADIATALMGPGRVTEFRQIVPLLERRGFPTIDGSMGGRYTPAIRAFFDREYGILGSVQISAPDMPAELGSWKGHRRTRRPKD
jgi:hypothetical protein